MKKRDILTSIGIVVGFGLVFWGMSSGKTNLMIFFDPASIAITVGGSFAALLIAYPISEMKRAMKVIGQSFRESTMARTEIISSFKNLSDRKSVV